MQRPLGGVNSPLAVEDQTEVGSYFVANYPPFSVWTKEAVAREAVSLTRDGLLRVDVLLKRFFLPEHAGIRYT